MISKEQLRPTPAVEQAETDQPATTLSRVAVRKVFRKTNRPKAVKPRPKRHLVPPFYFLRTDLNVLLGPSGGKLLNNTWSKFHLNPNERAPERLRPALLKLFSVAARIAAPRGVGQALRRLLADFERTYFPVVEDPALEAKKRNQRRFALLSVIQNGQGGALLNSITSESQPAITERTLPSRLIEEDPTRARRRFLFEAAYRSKSWSEAYRQGRLLLAQGTPRNRLGRKFSNTCRQLLGQEGSESKKKQVLSDLAGDERLSVSERLEMALRAASPYPRCCRPGSQENMLRELLPPGNPWWRCSLNRLYRHCPTPLTWLSDLRSLWQCEPWIRPQLRVLLNTLRLPRGRALSSICKRGLADKALARCGQDRALLTLEKVRGEVSRWQGLVPPVDEDCTSGGAVVKLPSHLWAFISEVCFKLGSEVPVYARTNFQMMPVEIGLCHGRRFISLSPEFLSSGSEARQFLLARALFRSATGLDALERRAYKLADPEHNFERAMAYAEWSGHYYPILEEACQGTATRESLLVGLEEMFWQTGDPAYRDFALVCHRRCWSPLFDRESDLFAASFVDTISASHALLKTDPRARRLVPVCEQQGLSTVVPHCQDYPAVCLRLQTLWFHYLDCCALGRD